MRQSNSYFFIRIVVYILLNFAFRIKTFFWIILSLLVSGHAASAPGPAAWLPRVPVWLPLWLLWCYPTQLHPASQPHPQCLPTQHEASWPFHTQSEGIHAHTNAHTWCHFDLTQSAEGLNLIICVSFTLGVQVDMLSEINIAPRILTNFTGVMPSQFKKDLDSYLKTRSPVTFLSELRSNLQVGAVSVHSK